MKAQSNDTTSRMAVLLHADVVGSTALVQRDERIAHRRITDALKSFSEVISSYGGIAHEVRGDALVAEFSRASDAVCAALAFQQSNQEKNRKRDDGIVPQIRVGIALGEAIFADATVTGAGVVLAQRIEQLATANGVCITGAVHEALPRRIPLLTTDLGEREAKGFDDLVRVYSVELKEDAEIPAPSAISKPRSAIFSRRRIIITSLVLLVMVLAGMRFAPVVVSFRSGGSEESQVTVADKPSIAVLPFDNMSGDPDQEYFADGITEDLTTDLSKISGLFVTARNSSFVYKDQSIDVTEVSRELGVRYVLEGSVRRAGNQVRINAQLIDGSTGEHIWAERFDGVMSDIFQLQDSVNRNIVDALAVSLTSAEQEQFYKVETKNPDAYDLLLRGLEQYQLFSKETNEEAREFLRRAIELDPGYARAYANIALTYAVDVNFSWTDNRDESTKLGLEYASKALELDSSIPQIFMTRSLLYLVQRLHEAAIESARRMVLIHPNYADGFATLAAVLSFAGELDEALNAIRKAKRIDPQYSSIYLGIEGRVLFLLGRYKEALPIMIEAVSRNPTVDVAQLMLAAIYSKLGLSDDASWAIEKALVIRPDISIQELRGELNYKREKDLGHFLDALREAGLPEF